MTQLRWNTVELTEKGKLSPSQTALFDDVVERHVGRGEYRGLEFLHVEARTVVNHIPNPGRFPFEYTINAYRGCSNACVYCFARPTHDYLGLNIGPDFDSKIVVKINAPAVVRHETAPARWARHPIAMGTNTDPYQSAEGKYKLTRQIIEVLTERKNPFSILTKAPLVLRDLDVLTEAAAVTDVRVDFSIGTLDEVAWSTAEPGTAHPQKRLDAVSKLNEAGIPSGVLMAPILPGLSDSEAQLEAVIAGAVEANARFIAGMYLHLRGSLKDHYLDWLADSHPPRPSSAPPVRLRHLGIRPGRRIEAPERDNPTPSREARWTDPRSYVGPNRPRRRTTFRAAHSGRLATGLPYPTTGTASKAAAIFSSG